MTERAYPLSDPEFFPMEDDSIYDAEDPAQLVLPGLPAGFLAYQRNHRAVKG